MNSRQALVIGNDAYAISPLPCCVNDAIGMKNALRSIGFHTHCETDRRIDQMQSLANRFVQSIQPGSIAIFYFSGHGLQCNGVNFLSPVDNDGDIDPDHMDRSRLNVQKLVDAMETRRPRLMIIILDACRSDAALKDLRRLRDRTASIVRPGLAPMRAPPGTIIAFACAADEVSYGKSKYGNNSVYTYHLLRYLTTPNVDIDLVLRKAAADVQQETKNVQTPFRYSSCNEVICLVSNAAMNHPIGLGESPQRMFMRPAKQHHPGVPRMGHPLPVVNNLPRRLNVPDHHRSSSAKAPANFMRPPVLPGTPMLRQARQHHQ